MKITINLDAKNLTEIEEAENLVNHLKVQAEKSRAEAQEQHEKVKAELKEEKRQREKEFAEWAKRFFNPKHHKPRFNEEIKLPDIMLDYENTFGSSFMTKRELKGKLSDWSSKNNFKLQSTNSYTIILKK